MIIGHDDGAEFSISTGAIIIAASELGIVWVPDGEHDALIGVNVDDVRARTMPGGPAQNDDAPQAETYFQRYAKEHGFRTDITFMDAITTPSPRECAVPGRIFK